MNRKLLFTLVLITLTALLFSGAANAQETIRTVKDWGTPYPYQPIEIVDKDLDGKPFLDKSRVSGEPDWWKQLTLSVKNISSKNIMSFDIQLLVEKDGKILMGIPLFFRTYNDPAKTSSTTLDGEKKLGVLRPGEIVKVKGPHRHMQKWAETLGRYHIDNLEQVRLDIRMVYFDDQSRWMFGQESKSDPERPGKRIPVVSTVQK